MNVLFVFNSSQQLIFKLNFSVCNFQEFKGFLKKSLFD